MLRRIHKYANPDPGTPVGIQVQSVNEIPVHLSVNPDMIYKWIDRKGLRAHKVGRLWKFLASEVDAWVKAGKAAQGSEDQES